jgi:hypothetical protein
VVVDVIGVILRVVPRKDLKEGAQQWDIGPRCAGDGASRHLTTDEVSISI